jgi:hypothetical protein
VTTESGLALSNATRAPEAVRVLELSHASPSEAARGGFRVEPAARTLVLVGWALGLVSPVARVEVLSNGQTVGRATPGEERPDIAEAFPGAAGAGASGFHIALEPSGSGRSQLRVRAELEDGRQVPLGDLRVETAR